MANRIKSKQKVSRLLGEIVTVSSLYNIITEEDGREKEAEKDVEAEATNMDANRARWAAHKQGKPEGRFSSEIAEFHKMLPPNIQKLVDALAVELDKDRRFLKKEVIESLKDFVGHLTISKQG